MPNFMSRDPSPRSNPFLTSTQHVWKGLVLIHDECFLLGFRPNPLVTGTGELISVF